MSTSAPRSAALPPGASPPGSPALGSNGGAQVGRADLLRLLASGFFDFASIGRTRMAAVAEILGFEIEAAAAEFAPGPETTDKSDTEVSDPIPKPDPPPSDTKPSAGPAAWPSDAAVIRNWQAVTHTLFEPPTERPRREPIARLHWSAQPTDKPVTVPLLSPGQLASRLRRLLPALGMSAELDIPRAVDRIARGEVATQFPHRPRRQWGSLVQVWQDTSNRLIPYLDDFTAITELLQRRLGDAVVESYLGHGAPSSPTDRGRDHREVDEYRLPPPGTLVLVLSDLGCLDAHSRADQARWTQFAKRLRAAGCHPLALVPCVRGRISAPLKRIYKVESLAVSQSQLSHDAHGRAVRRLLSMVAFAVRVEPGLLRDCRRLLPELGDPGLESDAWQRSEFTSRPRPAGTLGPIRVLQPLIAEFETLSPEVRRGVLNAFRRWRWRKGNSGLGCELFFEELSRLSGVTRALLSAEEIAEMAAVWRWLAEEVAKPSARQCRPAWHYAKRLLARVTVEAHLNPQVSTSLAQIRGGLSGEGSWSSGEYRVLISQVGGQWRLRGIPEREAGHVRPHGSPLATLRARGPVLAFRMEAESGGEPAAWQTLTLPAEGEAVWSPPSLGVVCWRSDCEEVTLRAGRWMVPQVGVRLACAAGRDSFGLWEETLIPAKTGEPVRVRWRWIPPGTFWQGSPEDEPGRSSNEGPRHLVTLTQGFWMADTPCTQTLWKGVMGKNPSWFEGDQHPVERVSWNTVQDFLKELNQLIPGLQASLPTEAQWEYACRAGSQTALYPTAEGDGTIEIVGEHKAPALDPIAWYGGNAVAPAGIKNPVDSSSWPEKQIEHKQASTQPVKGKLPNAWGLYDMLGNVYEWCRDGWHKYVSEHAIDPGGSKTGGSVGSRVLRGGSWLSLARYVRCARRDHRPADRESNFVSFRLVRVQEKDREPGQQSSET